MSAEAVSALMRSRTVPIASRPAMERAESMVAETGPMPQTASATLRSCQRRIEPAMRTDPTPSIRLMPLGVNLGRLLTQVTLGAVDRPERDRDGGRDGDGNRDGESKGNDAGGARAGEDGRSN